MATNNMSPSEILTKKVFGMAPKASTGLSTYSEPNGTKSPAQAKAAAVSGRSKPATNRVKMKQVEPSRADGMADKKSGAAKVAWHEAQADKHRAHANRLRAQDTINQLNDGAQPTMTEYGGIVMPGRIKAK